MWAIEVKLKETSITIKIDRRIYNEFKIAIIRHYGRAYGHMYDEWNEALEQRTRQLQAALDDPIGLKTTIYGPEDGDDD